VPGTTNHRIQLVLLFGLLLEDAAHALQHLLALGLELLRQRAQLAMHVALDAAHPGAQRLNRRAHAFVLLGMRIAALLRGQPGRLAVVVLTPAQTMVVRELDRVLTAALE
jgi:hypothetical protein